MKLALKIKFNKIKKILPKAKPILSGLILIVAGFTIGANLQNLKAAILTPRVSVLASEKISAKQLESALADKDFTLINVHTPYDGEIVGTDLFLEHDLLKTNRDKLPEDKNARIILYCKSGNMSAVALQTLKGMGYTNVKHLDGGMKSWERSGKDLLDLSTLEDVVVPKEGVALPISWGNVGPELISIGAIDLPAFEETMDLTSEQKDILTKGSDSPIVISSENSRFVVNMLWALGLAQKSKVYVDGPMGQEHKDSVGNFASTGGWSLARGNAVNYLNKHDIIPLTEDQQSMVYEIASNVYRPCCGNSTAFPDCNHGMAALAAIELMVSAGIPEDEIYKNLLTLNSYWFSDTYITLAAYFARMGVDWDELDAKTALGQEFSSAKGAGEVREKVGPLPGSSIAGGSCGA